MDCATCKSRPRCVDGINSGMVMRCASFGRLLAELKAAELDRKIMEMLPKMPIIVNLFGGPGSGKSTTRAGVFNLLKLQGIVCEEAFEWIKYKVYEGNTYAPTDQIYTFAKQRKTLREIGSQVDVIITDSPLLLSIIYDNEQDPILRLLVLKEFSKFNNLNFLLMRSKPYCQVGRYQDEQGALQVDDHIQRLLRQEKIPFGPITGDEDAAKRIAAAVVCKLRFSK